MKLKLLTVLVLALVALPTSVARASNDFVDTELRVDLSSVDNAQDYITNVYAAAQPNTGGSDFTTGWLGVYLAQYNGTVYSGQFSQVGLMTDQGGVKWFVYAEPGVTCLRGSQAWGSLGCVGAYNDYATLGAWQKVEMVTYGQGYWIARVYNSSGSSVDVARINSSSLHIYRGFQVGEEGYSEATDPYLTMSYYHFHPQYMTGSGFQDWPASSGGQNNYLFTSPSSICPGYYGASINVNNDPRFWFTGSGATTCNANPLF